MRECFQMKRAALVNIFLESVIRPDGYDSTESLSINQIIDVAQDLPDDVWFAISKEVMEEEEHTFTFQKATPLAKNPMKYQMQCAMFTILGSWPDQNETIADAQNSEVIILVYEHPNTRAIQTALLFS